MPNTDQMAARAADVQRAMRGEKPAPSAFLLLLQKAAMSPRDASTRTH